MGIPYVGSDPYTIAVAIEKSLAKKLWLQAGLPTAPFGVVNTMQECDLFLGQEHPPYPLFLKPVAGRGSAGISPTSVVHSDAQLRAGVKESENLQDRLGVSFQRLSGGNSSNYQWMKTTSDLGTVNHVRIGESILLGCDSVSHEPLGGFATDAFTLVTEVIELREKVVQGRAMRRGLLALGWQDVDINTVFSSGGLPILGATSDHLVVDASGQDLRLGEEVSFSVGYRAMMGAMASPYVEKVYRAGAVA